MYSNEKMMAKLAVNKSVLKEYYAEGCSRAVYMNNNDEFQIQLFNPENFVVGAEIYINGEVLPGKIVLQPGERVWIERYTDKHVKFKFNTYEVEANDSDVKQAIAKNGDVVIKFYKEMPRTTLSTSVSYSEPLVFSDNLVNNVKTSTYHIKGICNAHTYKSSDFATFGATLGAVENSSPVLGKVDTFCAEIDEPKSRSVDATTMETGRIGEGSYSSQNFNRVYNEFEYSPYHIETMKILPMSRKPYTAQDLQKVYCTECGRKLNPKFKYCPYCGAKCI